MNPLARTAGHALAVTSLVLAFAAAAQGPVANPPEGRGAFVWLFALFIAIAVVAIFIFVLWLVRGGPTRDDAAPRGAGRRWS